jgi:signal transduction histidine kinase
VALRRRYLPAAVAIVTTATFLVFASATTATASGIVAQLGVLTLVAERYGRRVSLLLPVPFLLLALSPGGRRGAALTDALLLALAVAALVLGDARRLRAQAVAERDASRHAMTVSLRDRAAMEERARIARELHDVVAHHVSMIAVQAESARLTTAGLPEEGRRRLEAIGATARDALTELRRLVGVLRADAGGEAERAPQPGLARLEELVGSARDAGTPVCLTLRGQVVPLPPGVDLTAYRIVQEALTNARRHGWRSSCATQPPPCASGSATTGRDRATPTREGTACSACGSGPPWSAAACAAARPSTAASLWRRSCPCGGRRQRVPAQGRRGRAPVRRRPGGGGR